MGPKVVPLLLPINQTHHPWCLLVVQSIIDIHQHEQVLTSKRNWPFSISIQSSWTVIDHYWPLSTSNHSPLSVKHYELLPFTQRIIRPYSLSHFNVESSHVVVITWFLSFFTSETSATYNHHNGDRWCFFHSNHQLHHLKTMTQLVPHWTTTILSDSIVTLPMVRLTSYIIIVTVRFSLANRCLQPSVGARPLLWPRS